MSTSEKVLRTKGNLFSTIKDLEQQLKEEREAHRRTKESLQEAKELIKAGRGCAFGKKEN